MANEERDEGYGRRTFGRALVLIGVSMGVGLCAVSQMEEAPRYFSAMGWMLVGVWVAILIGGIVWVKAVERNYRCRKCGTLLRKRQEAATKYEVRFHCDGCHVTWTTGVYPGDG